VAVEADFLEVQAFIHIFQRNTWLIELASHDQVDTEQKRWVE
jgi:hypothetical protein